MDGYTEDEFIAKTISETNILETTALVFTHNKKKRENVQEIASMCLFLRDDHARLHGFSHLLWNEKSNREFFKLCRVTKKTFQFLVTSISQNMPPPKNLGGKPSIGLQMAVMITLWYLGRQCTYSEISEQFGVTISTAGKYVQIVIDNLMKIFPDIISWPSIEKVPKVESDFKNLSTFPGVIGAIDGCHIKIKAPEEYQKDYLDRTRNHSINLLAVCDANKKFTYINVGFPGSAHDQRVLSNSSLGIQLEDNSKSLCYSDKYHIIGDSAFALKTYLMVPFKDYGSLDAAQLNYNNKLSMSRRVIENSFGWLKGRFRRLKYVEAKISNITDIVKAACILHNLTLESEEERLLMEAEGSQEDLEIRSNHSSSQECRSGTQKRDRIMHSLI